MEPSEATYESNIVLIGMPGAGKSTVGVVLAKMLNYGFVDVDLVIQQQAGRTLHELIESLGIEGFISLEGDALEGLDVERCVVSTGGSAVYSSAAMEALGKQDIIVYLKISIEALSERLSDFTERGVVMRASGPITLETLYAERVQLYESFADVTIDVTALSITEAARAIRAALGM